MSSRQLYFSAAVFWLCVKLDDVHVLPSQLCVDEREPAKGSTESHLVARVRFEPDCGKVNIKYIILRYMAEV